MARRIERGDVWLHGFDAPDERRPVVVISRSSVIPVMHTVLVAAISSTIHGIPSEVVIGPDEGMKGTCAISLDHVHTVRQRDLERRVATLSPEIMARVCAALRTATGC